MGEFHTYIYLYREKELTYEKIQLINNLESSGVIGVKNALMRYNALSTLFI